MVWFQKKALNNICPSMCNPIIVNQTENSIVVFLDRGVLYNKQILQPGEAVAMTRQETAGTVVPYKIHAVVGDEKAFPTEIQSMKNLISTAAIPTAFIVGTLMAAYSAGTSTAVTRAAGSVVVRGMVIDSAALAAGSLSASKAAYIADQLIEKHPENFSAKSGLCMPGQRYVVIRGGIEAPLTITDLSEKKFRQIPIVGECKVPMDTLREKVEFYTPSIFQRFSLTSSKKEAEDGSSSSEDEAEDVTPAIENTTREMAVEGINNPPPATAPGAVAPSAPTSAEQEEEEERQLRQALAESASAQQHESEEDRQLREAIEASLKVEEDRKRQQEEYKKALKDHDSNCIPVTLF